MTDVLYRSTLTDVLTITDPHYIGIQHNVGLYRVDMVHMLPSSGEMGQHAWRHLVTKRVQILLFSKELTLQVVLCVIRNAVTP